MPTILPQNNQARLQTSRTSKHKASYSKVCPGYPKERSKIIEIINAVVDDEKEREASLIDFCHIRRSYNAQPKKNKNGWVPFSFKLRRSKHKQGYTNREPLLEAGIFQRTGYSIEQKISYCWRIHLSIHEELDMLAMEEALSGAEPIDLYTGNKLPILHNNFHDDAGNKIPDLVEETIKELSPVCFVDNGRLIEYLKDEETSLKRTKEQFGKDSEEYETHFYKVSAVRHCYLNYKAQYPVHVGDGIHAVRPGYEMQEAGRKTSRGGIVQNWRRDMKAVAFTSIQEEGIKWKQADGSYERRFLFNYDLRSSQINGLIQQIALAGLVSVWLENYRDNKSAKLNYAKKIFNFEEGSIDAEGKVVNLQKRQEIAIDTVKSIVCSIIMSAEVPKFSNDKAGRDKFEKMMKFVRFNLKKVSAPLKYLYEYYEATGQDIRKAWWAYQRLLVELAPLIEIRAQWHEWLLKVWLPENKFKVVVFVKDERTGKKVREERFYVKNAYGCKMRIDDLDARKLKSKLSAHLLQGQEAYYISAITRLSSKYGYLVLMNEHDGVITLGEIPVEAQEEAAQETGTLNAELIEKRFESDYYSKEDESEKPGEPIILSLETCFEPFELAEPGETNLLLEALKQQYTGINYNIEFPELKIPVIADDLIYDTDPENNSYLQLYLQAWQDYKGEPDNADEYLSPVEETTHTQAEEIFMSTDDDEFLTQLIEQIPAASAQQVMCKVAAPKPIEPVTLSQDDAEYLEHVTKGIWDFKNERLLAVINEKPMYINAETLLHWSFVNNENDPFTTLYTVGLTFISDGGRLFCEKGVQVYGSYQFKESSYHLIEAPFSISCTGQTVSTSVDLIDEAGAIAITANLLNKIIGGMKSY